MNFKPNILKCVLSLLSGVGVNYLLSLGAEVMCLLPANDPNARCPQPTWMDIAFDPGPVMISVIVIALVYTIWSFVQKK